MGEAAGRNIWEILGSAGTASSESSQTSCTANSVDAVDNESMTMSPYVICSFLSLS